MARNREQKGGYFWLPVWKVAVKTESVAAAGKQTKKPPVRELRHRGARDFWQIRKRLP